MSDDDIADTLSMTPEQLKEMFDQDKNEGKINTYNMTNLISK